MQTKQVDVAIIGAGTAGLNARTEAAKAGASWVLIESGAYGTTCARVGCMPSKLVIAAAERAHQVAEAGQFGIDVDRWAVDGAAVLERVRAERDRFVGFVVDSTEALDAERRLSGRARFVGPNCLEVGGLAGGDDVRVEFGAAVVATGSHPWIPPQLEPIGDDVMVSDDVFELETLPESMAVFGTGSIGLELGQALARLGVDVQFFNPFDALGRFSDPQLIDKAHQVFEQRLTLHLQSELTAVGRTDGGYRLEWTDVDGHAHHASFECVMSAAGRHANVDPLDLDQADVPLDDHGRPISDPLTLQCGQTPIFVAGDVSGHRPILHEAADEGRIAGSNAARFSDVLANMRKSRLEITFTSPQMGIVGKRYDELDPDTIAVGQASYDNQGRARVMGLNCGLIRLYATRHDGRLVGAEMLGPRVEHTAHLLGWMVQDAQTVGQILNKPVYHPVFEEGIRSAVRDLGKNLRIAGLCNPQDRGSGPGA